LTSYRDLLRQKNRKIQGLETEIKKLRNLSLLTHDKFKFDSRQDAIIKYLRKNPEAIQTDLISSLQRYGSYVTLFKTVMNLRKMNVIRRERIHKQKYKLILNDANILVTTYDNLNDYKKLFQNLITKISENRKWRSGFNEHELSDKLVTAAIMINHHVLNVYTMQILLKWSIELRDDYNLLNKLYSILFSTVFDINLELARKFRLRIDLVERPTPVHMMSPVLYNMVSDSFLLTPNRLIEIICEYRKFNLHKELAQLVDIVWRISFPMFRYFNLGTLSDLLGSPENVESTGRQFVKLLGLDLMHPSPYGKLGLNFKSDEHKADFTKILYELSHEN
jgi:hypothetical protein